MLGDTLTGYIRDTTRYLVILDSLTSEVSLLCQSPGLCRPTRASEKHQVPG